MTRYLVFKERIYRIRPTIEFYFLMATFPFLILSMIVFLLSLIGVSVIVDGYTEPDIPVTQEDKDFVRDIFNVIFIVYPLYTLGLMFTLIFLLITWEDKPKAKGMV